MSALLDQTAVPDLPADPTALITAAESLISAARIVRQRTEEAATRWTTLSEHFQTPDTATVITALRPAVTAAIDFEDASVAASTALRTLGETLTGLAWTRQRLLDDIAARRASVQAAQERERACTDESDPMWRGSGLGFSPDDDLALRCSALRGLIEAALDECERDLRRIGGMSLVSPVMWARVRPTGPALTAQQRSSVFGATISMTILERLAGREQGGVAGLLTEHPEWLTMVRDHAPVATDVAAWWRDLDATHAASLTAGAPLLIGNLEGVAYTARDAANRASLTARIAEARAAVEEERMRAERDWGEARGGGEWRGGRGAVLRDRLATLLIIEAALGSAPKAPKRYLVSLTDDQPPLAAVAIGNLDEVGTVTFAVPGMGTTSADMSLWSDAAQNLLSEQLRTSVERDYAVVAWVGYEAPPVPVREGRLEVLENEHARAGGSKLSAAISGLIAARPSIEAVNVVGHSYGTTTAALALTMSSTPQVDAFVALGSAGFPAYIDSATDLRATATYAGQARNVIPLLEDGQGDEWAWIGRSSLEHPIDPASRDFGGHAFGADGDNGMHPVTHHNALVQPGDGWGYFDSGTEALRNAALATTRQGDRITEAVEKGRTEVQQYWDDVMRTSGFGL